jgi:hypothetical protein
MTTRVWRRYGQLRIYVLASELDGHLEVGWCDPRTGRFALSALALSQPDAAGAADAFWAEVAAECQRLQQAGRLGHAVLPAALAARLPAPPVLADPPVAAEAAAVADPASWADDAHWVARDPEWDDLAANQPGAAALARSRELRRERPVRSTATDLLGFRSPARRFAIGAKGERIVGRRLDRWAGRRGWHVLHAVPVGRGSTDIDHVVIGPFGVVTVNTKMTGTSVWAGQQGMKVGGTTVDYLRKSRAERARAGRLLAQAIGARVPVQSVIVFVGARRFTLAGGGPRDVVVLRAPRDLRRWLRRQGAVLDAARVAALYAAARQPETWQPRPPRPPRSS